MFKNNTKYIIPFILDNNKLVKTKYLIFCDIEKVGFHTYLILKYKVDSIKAFDYIVYNLEKEKHIYYLDKYSCSTITAKLLIPKTLEFTVSSIKYLGHKILSEKDLDLHNKFWDFHYFVCFNKKPGLSKDGPGSFYSFNPIILCSK